MSSPRGDAHGGGLGRREPCEDATPPEPSASGAFVFWFGASAPVLVMYEGRRVSAAGQRRTFDGVAYLRLEQALP